MNKIDKVLNQLSEEISSLAPHLLGAIVVFIFGNWAINWLSKQVGRGLVKKKVDVSLQSFLASLVSVVLKVLLLVTVAGMIGIQTTSFVAILGAAGLAVGLALQGSLANFAGGVLVLVFKPYKVGDFIESQGIFGEVKEVQIFNTLLLTPDNKTAILPNGAVSNGSIINHSRHGSIVVDVQVNIAPENDLDATFQIIKDCLIHDERILKDPKPEVFVFNLFNDGATLTIRPSCQAVHYWDVRFATNKLVKEAFAKHGITSPRQDLYLNKQVLFESVN